LPAPLPKDSIAYGKPISYIPSLCLNSVTYSQFSASAYSTFSWARRHLDTHTDRQISRYLFFLSLLHLLLMLVFGLAPTFLLAAIAFLAITVVVDLKRPLLSVWINRHAASQVRATVLSMHGQMDAIGQTMGGPGLGVIGTVGSLRIVMILVAALLVPTVGVYGKAAAQAAAQENPETKAA